ncbi:MAG: site-2 protease family protein [Candidatus Eremiobacteraeota bacterium]|nr:site-2 protease family protein [Candidatus Eremiobacteraeota bacterium]MBV8354400.1 site-2 protease family protein [Candidatus Eremiobacteraeota bacterium]
MRIGRVLGIEITVHVTWLFVFAFVAWSLSSDVGPFGHLDVSPWERAAFGLFTSLFFFASVLIHELAHSVLARSRGIPVRGITLFIFGGVSQFEGEAEDAPGAAWISAIGPLTSLILAAIFYGLYRVSGFGTPLATAFGYLAFANFLLAIFNILPAYPLDGGRVLQALVWRATGDRFRATRDAVVVGRIFAWLFIVLGVAQALMGAYGGIWLTFIGWFLLQAGAAEGVQSEVRQALGGHTVGELAVAGTAIAPDTTADAALQVILRTGSRALPVMLGDSLLGIVALEDIGKVPPEDLPRTYVTAIMTREADLPSVTPETPAVDAMQVLAKSGRDQLPVMTAAGQLVGFITQENILRWVAAHRHLQSVRR